MQQMTVAQCIQCLETVRDAVHQHSQYLIDLDTVMGDGDLGLSLARGLDSVVETVSSSAFQEVGELLTKAGMALNRAAPSTFGTLLATAFIRAGMAAKGKSVVDATLMAAMLGAARDGVAQRGKANLGDKTILDVLAAAAEAAGQAAAAGQPLGEACAAVLGQVEAVWERMRDWPARVGRASWFKERTVGADDPGASAFVIMWRAVSAYTGGGDHNRGEG